MSQPFVERVASDDADDADSDIVRIPTGTLIVVDADEEASKADELGQRSRASSQATPPTTNATSAGTPLVSKVARRSLMSTQLDSPLDDAIAGFVDQHGTMWNYDLSWKRLIPGRFVQEVPFERTTATGNDDGGFSAGSQRMVRTLLWSKYGQPMHFISLEFKSLAMDIEYDKDTVRRNQRAIRIGLLCVCIGCFIMAAVKFANSDEGTVEMDSAHFHILLGFTFLLQYTQFCLDRIFVNRQMQQVLCFWSFVQASCFQYYLWAYMPMRYPPDICGRAADAVTQDEQLLINEVHAQIVEKIMCFTLLGIVVYRMRFLYFLYYTMYLFGGFLVFVAYQGIAYDSSTPCFPRRRVILNVARNVLVFLALRYMNEVSERKDFIQASMVWKESTRAGQLLHNILPGPVIEKLKGELVSNSRHSYVQKYREVTVLFADVVSFTTMSAQISASTLVELLNRMFLCFDDLAEKSGVEKIKTIGDCYMCAGGLPLPNPYHAHSVARFGLQMLEAMASGDFRNPATGEPLRVRAGLHSGPAVAGVIGHKKFAYDLWGDAVNTASRMESHGEAMRLHCSESSYEKVQHYFECEARPPMMVKGKGQMKTYFVVSEREEARQKSFVIPKEQSARMMERGHLASITYEDTSRDPDVTRPSVFGNNVRLRAVVGAAHALSRVVSSLGQERRLVDDGDEEVELNIVPEQRRE